MTRDEKIAWLKRYAEAEREIDHLIEQVRRLASAAQYPTMDFDRLKGPGSTGSRQERYIEQIAMLQEKMLLLMDEATAYRDEIETAIAALPYSQRSVLAYRYIDGLRWDGVAKKADFCLRSIHRLHGQALESLDHIPEMNHSQNSEDKQRALTRPLRNA